MDKRYAQLTSEERVEIYCLDAEGESRQAVAVVLNPIRSRSGLRYGLDPAGADFE